jgi:hypothetical protein
MAVLTPRFYESGDQNLFVCIISTFGALSDLCRQDPSFNIPRLVLNCSSSRSVTSCHLEIVTFLSSPITSLLCVRISTLGSISTSKSLSFPKYAIYPFVHMLAFVNCSRFCLNPSLGIPESRTRCSGRPRVGSTTSPRDTHLPQGN